jgi:hypothetical protein
MPTPSTIEWLIARSGLGGKMVTGYSWQGDVSTNSVFGKDLQLINHLQEMIDSKYLLELEKPLDEHHSQMLREDGKLITRKTLLHGKYRVSIRIHPSQAGNRWVQNYRKIKEIREWFDQQFGDDIDRATCFISTKANFHFRDAKDAMLLKLVWGGETPMKMERILTFDELKDMSPK